MLIQCKNCGKTIEKKGQRTLCIRCRNLADKLRIAERIRTDEYKEKARQRYLARKKESH